MLRLNLKVSFHLFKKVQNTWSTRSRNICHHAQALQPRSIFPQSLPYPLSHTEASDVHDTNPWGHGRVSGHPSIPDASLLYHGNRGTETSTFHEQTDQSACLTCEPIWLIILHVCNFAHVHACAHVCNFACVHACAHVCIYIAREGPSGHWESCKRTPVRRETISPYFNGFLVCAAQSCMWRHSCCDHQ